MRIFVFLICSFFTVALGIINKNVVRNIDIQRQFLEILDAITIDGPETEYVYFIDPLFQGHLSYVEAKMSSGTEKDLEIRKQSNDSFVIDMPQSVGERKLLVKTKFTHVFSPYPVEITQSEKQFLRFYGNAFLYSQYFTEKQETAIVLPPSLKPHSYYGRVSGNPNVLSYTKNDMVTPVKRVDTKLVYGPYKSREPFSEAPIVVHYECNTPILTIKEITRVIEVCHWGNIAVEEHIHVYHEGAKLKGSFSRFDYQQQQDGYSSVKVLNTLLPAAARDVYYRDEIGNISTSNLREMESSVLVELRPRFPLFGGWQTRYTIGYNVPSYEYLYNKGSHFQLQMRFLDHVFDDMVVDRLTVKLVLPEYSRNIKLRTPFSVERLPDEHLHTYLDMGVGRPVIIMQKDNLVENHIVDFNVSYEFSKILLIREPLMVVGAFMLLFLSVIVYVRLDFSISKVFDRAAESKLYAKKYIEDLHDVLDRRSALYQSYDDVVSSYKSGKNLSRFMAERKKIDKDHKSLSQEVVSLMQSLRAENRDAAERVADIQQLDSQYRDVLNQEMQTVEKVVSGQASRNVEAEQRIASKKNELVQRMETVKNAL